jgi:hypothetical protein
MTSPNKPAGQRDNLSSASGRKERSATSASHTGSRVEPSHTTDKARELREQKIAGSAARAAVKNASPKGVRPTGTNQRKGSGR